MNLGVRIPLGLVTLSFSFPQASIAAFEIVIGLVLLVSAALSNLYVYCGAYLFSSVGIIEGLLSNDIQGLARSIHETMIPFAVLGWALVVIEARNSYGVKKNETGGQGIREIVAALQFFVGGLVTLGGAAYAKDGAYPTGTALGFVHLAVGLTGLFGGYFFLKRKPGSQKFLIAINVLTIVYSAFAESLAEIYAFLEPGINDALIGTIVAIVVSATIIYLLVSKSSPSRLLKESTVEP